MNILFNLLLPCIIIFQPYAFGEQRPLPDDLTLPMPNGASMVFRPVFLGAGDDPFAHREFSLGGGNDFRENPTKVQLSGAFRKDNNGKPDTLYYIGKTKVTVGQFAAMTGNSIQLGLKEENLPKTNVTWMEVQQFIAQYNDWLLNNARPILPERDKASGYLRLPTEAEWEFAARGGSVVDKDVFDRQVPYGGNLTSYEWFEGTNSSNGKLKSVGILDPNALGLHDMLGNAKELVEGTYQIEYYQSRPGGHIVRGGSFRTPEGAVRVSARTEQPPYDPTNKPSKSDDIGFRLVISAPVFTGLAALNQIKDAWHEYAKSRDVPMPPQVSASPVIIQTHVGLADTARIIDELEKLMGNNGKQPVGAREQLNLLRASFSDIESSIVRAEKEIAVGGVHQASDAVYRITRNLSMLELDVANRAGWTQDEFAERKAKWERRVQFGKDRLAYALDKVLIMGRSNIVLNEFDLYLNELKKLGDVEQAQVTERSKSIYVEYEKVRRLQMDRWEEGFREDAVGWLKKK